MRLIDADDAIKCVAEIIIKKSDIELETATQQALAYDIALTHARHLINGIPTAYDVEAVVAELKKIRDDENCDNVITEDCLSCKDCNLCLMNRAISIVRGKE